MDPIKEEVQEEKKEGQKEKGWLGKLIDFLKSIDEKADSKSSSRFARGALAAAGLVALLERFEEVRSNLWAVFCTVTGGGYKIGKVAKEKVVDPVIRQAAVYFRVGFVGMLAALIIGVGAFILYFGGLTGQPWYAMLFTIFLVALLISWGAEQAASVIVPSLTVGGVKWERHIVISVIAVAFFTFFATMSAGAVLQAAIYLLIISMVILIVSAVPLACVGYWYYKIFFRSDKFKGNPERPSFRHFANLFLLPVVNFLLICSAIFLYAQYFGAWLIAAGLMVNIIVAIIALKLAGLSRWWVKLLNNTIIIVGIIFFLAIGTVQMFYKAAPPNVQKALNTTVNVFVAKFSNNADKEALVNRLPGDIDGNGKSDLDDLKWLREMVKEGLVLPEAIAAWGDVTNDGVVDSLDFKLFETGNDRLFQRPEKLLQKLGLIKKPVVVEVKQQPPDTTKKAVTPQVTAAPPKQEFTERVEMVTIDAKSPYPREVDTPKGKFYLIVNDQDIRKGRPFGAWTDNDGGFSGSIRYKADGSIFAEFGGDRIVWTNYNNFRADCDANGYTGDLPDGFFNEFKMEYLVDPDSPLGALVGWWGNDGKPFLVGTSKII